MSGIKGMNPFDHKIIEQDWRLFQFKPTELFTLSTMMLCLELLFYL
jgi:hypothetical protein